jgi:hypothetical protein
MFKETQAIAPQGQRFIKEKFGSIVVDIAKRDWPQRWEVLVSELCRIAPLGQVQAEMALIIIRTLAESASQNESDMPGQRKVLPTP